MSKWNGKRFSIYKSEEKNVLGLIKELGEQTNYNTDELEQVKINDNKKVSHKEMQDTYKIDKDANFTGSWHGIKKPTKSQEGLQATVDKIVEEDIPSINEQMDKIVIDIDNSIIKYPIKLGIEDILMVKNPKYPYLHVHRYGAIGDGVTDCTAAIQYAVDLAEKHFNRYYYGQAFPIKFESGVYKITKTIKCRYNKGTLMTPIWFEGVACENLQTISGGKFTQIKPQITKQGNLGYASAFSINSVFENDIDMDICTNGETIPIQVGNGVSFRNIAIQVGNKIDGSGVDKEEMNNYDIVGIKCFNTRLTVSNCAFYGLQYAIYQPRRSGQCNDMCVYENIRIHYPKKGGLYLTYADCCRIEDVQSHYMINDKLDSLIDIHEGSSITINNIHSAEYGENVDGEFTPKNLGSGKNGDKALFKFSSLYGLELSNIYTERPFLDYIVCLNSVRNVKIHGHNERFISNGFIKIKGENFNIQLDNIYRNANLISEYSDIYVVPGADIRGFKCTNFMCRNYYQETLTLDSDYRRSVLNASSGHSLRKIVIDGISKEMYCNKNFNCESINFIIYYDGTSASFKAMSQCGKGITHIVGSLSWKDNSLDLSNMNIGPFRINSVTNDGYLSNPLDVFIEESKDKTSLKFVGSSGLLTSPNDRMRILLNVDCLCNIVEFTR